jgi:hypothetical protein
MVQALSRRVEPKLYVSQTVELSQNGIQHDDEVLVSVKPLSVSVGLELFGYLAYFLLVYQLYYLPEHWNS